MLSKISSLKKYLPLVLLAITSLYFSSWLMWHTFSSQEGQILVSSKVYSDFANHIPLIRSFSFGSNFPPEYPLFPGEQTRFHFLFYMIVGILEKTGLPIGLALNLPSAVSFFVLIISIFLFAKLVSKSRSVAILSVIFFLFNGSLSFIEYFRTHTLSLEILNEITTNRNYPSFGPYDNKIVSAFWNLNIYTNQRHLALSIAILLLLTFTIVRNEELKKRINPFTAIFWGIVVGILLLFNSSIFIITVAILGMLFITIPSQRMSILIILTIGGILALIRLTFVKEITNFIPVLKLGYLIGDKLSLYSFLRYWFMNLGLFLFLIPLGFLYASKLTKRVFIAYFSLFIIGNTIQISPEIASNHKFFNVFLIAGNIVVAEFLVRLWKKSWAIKIITLPIFFLLIFSGIIDFFPLKNDYFIPIDDYPKNPDVVFIVKNTPKNSVFLNSTYLYHPASLAGRKIFLGWPYFSWSAGYNTDERSFLVKQIYESINKKDACSLLIKEGIDYLEIHKPPDREDLVINYSLFENSFNLVYGNQLSKYYFYNVKDSCYQELNQ